MSEFINNKEYRQSQLKELIKKLHDGATVDEVKAEFALLSQGISAIEITEMEQALVDDGMPIAEIQRLCDVHASVFKGSIEEIHQDAGGVIPDFDGGNLMQSFKKENRAIEALIQDQVLPLLSQYTESNVWEDQKLLLNSVEELFSIDQHYKRKENVIFPYMEKYGITAPPQVMWGVDDEIRDKLKAVIALLKEKNPVLQEVNSSLREVINQINEMIFKEEEIMFPMIMERLTQKEWQEIEEGNSVQLTDNSTQSIAFDAGRLLPEEINAILNTLPLDMTFVDANNRVKYFTQGKERIFDRPKTILGREVKNCHPPKSVHVVEQIVDDLRSGKKDNEDFWIKMGDLFVYIRYFAVRNSQGEFLGTLEITQNIKPIQELEGEKRLMS